MQQPPPSGYAAGGPPQGMTYAQPPGGGQYYKQGQPSQQGQPQMQGHYVQSGQPMYAAPAPGTQYYPPQGYPQQTVVMGTPPPQEIIIVEQGGGYTGGVVGFSRNGPTQCVCPNCRQAVVTNVIVEPGTTAWLCCCVLAFVFWPLACLPFCLPSCQDTVHTCPACGCVISRLEASGSY